MLRGSRRDQQDVLGEDRIENPARRALAGAPVMRTVGLWLVGLVLVSAAALVVL